MSISSGDKLGPYEIQASIGAGGMGVVYRAKDPRLNRDVAIKVSAAQFSERFEREAKAIAALNHPNICQIYDVGPNYLVMEFIDGEPLKGPLPLDQALKYAAQICDALDAAHKKNITHRDLKPGNILLTKAGVKLLDFGLAKMGPAVHADEATMTMALTGKGEIPGTLLYMSPEQLQGKEADARSDIFACGLVLYEMLTGKRAFQGSSPASVIAAILERPAPSVAETVPAGVDRLLRKCLAKDPDQRWQSARDLKDELEWLAQAAPAVAPIAQTPARKPRLWQSLTALLALVAAGLAGWTFWPKSEPPAQITRFQVALPEGASFNQYVSLSPDGRKLVFNSTGAQDGMWIRDMESLEWRRLPGTEGAVSPFWSPDSRFLGFAVGSQLKKIDVSGGPAQTLCTVPTGAAGSGAWGRDGIIVLGSRAGPLWKISQAGGVATPITLVDAARGEATHTLPSLMPDGKHFVYLRGGTPEVQGMYAGSLDTKPEAQSRERILPGQFAASYVNGYLFFVRESTLMAQPFDAGQMQLHGDAVPVAEHVGTTGRIGVFSVSPSGALAYRSGAQSGSYQLTWFDRQGKILSTFGQPTTDQLIVLSPNATRGVTRDAAFNGAGDLWTLEFARGVRTRFTFRQNAGSGGVWSPDGSRIAFASGNALDTLYEKPSSGAGDEKELLREPGRVHVPTSWSRDGRFLLYYNTIQATTGDDVSVLPLQGDRKPVLLLGSAFNEHNATFSPDMRWIAYASNESGVYQIYVRPFTASGPSDAPSLGEGRWQISKDGGDNPKWRADGKEIVFEATPAGTAKFAVAVKANGAAFEMGIPERLFVDPGGNGWDMAGDGKRFLLAEPQGQQTAQVPITVVLNWPAQLKKN